MASPVDISTEQLRLMEELNRTLIQVRENTSAIANNMGALSNQSQAFQDINNVASDASQSMSDLTEETNKTLTAFESFGNFFDDLPEKVGKTILGEKGYLIAKSAFESLSDGFNLLTTNAGNFYDALSGPAAAVFGFLGEAYKLIINKANELLQKSLEYARALENVRDKFGSFNETTSKTIKNTAEGLRSSLKEAAGGVDVFSSKFSPGVDGLIESLQYSEEVIGQMGSTLDYVGRGPIEGAKAQIYLLNKALGFNAEQITATTKLATLAGKDINTFMNDVSESTLKVGKKLGISSKELGKDVAKGLTNFKLLGKLTGDYVNEMIKASAYTRKLGIEIEKLTGLVEKFDNFDNAAESAASLAQAFGMVLDPLTMGAGASVQEKLKQVQNSFSLTGRSIDDLNRVERSYLANQLGMEEGMLITALSAKGLSMSYDEIQESANSALKEQKTNEEVFRELADSVKNVVVGFSDFAGLFDAFLNGLLDGIGVSKNFRDIIEEFSKSLGGLYHIGRGVGRILSTMFLGGAPGAAREFLSVVMQIATNVGDFFKNIDDGKATLPQKLEALFSTTTDLVSGYGKKLWSSITSPESIGKISNMGATIVNVFTTGIDWAIDKLIPSITDFIDTLFTGASGAGKENPLEKSLSNLFTIERLEKLQKGVGKLLDSIAGMLIRSFAEYPWATTLATLFIGGGPLLTAVNSFISDMGTILGEQASAAGGAAGVLSNITKTKGAESLKDGILTRAAKDIVGGIGAFASPMTDAIKSVFNIIEAPAKISLMTYAIVESLKMLAEGLQEIFLSFTEPRYGKEGTKKSFIDILVENVKKFETVGLDSLLKLGVILVAAGAAVAAVAWGASEAIGKMKPGLGMAAAIAAFFIVSSVSGEAAANTFGKIAQAISSAVISIANFFIDPKITDAMSKLVDARPNIETFGSVIEVVGKAITNFMGMADALPKTTKGLITGEIDTESLVKTSDGIKKLFEGNFVSNIASIKISDENSNNLAGLVESEAIYNLGEIISSLKTASTDLPESQKITDLQGVVAKIADTTFVGNLNYIFSNLFSNPGESSTTASAFGTLKTIFVDQLEPIISAMNNFDGVNGILKMVDTVKLIPWAIDEIKMIMDSVAGKLAVGIGIPKQKNKNKKGPVTFPFFESIKAYTELISQNSVILAESNLETLRASLEGIVTKITEIRSIIENLPDIKLETLIDEVKDNMVFTYKPLEVAGGAVKINIQMNVNMNAMKLAGELVMDGYVRPTPEFDNFLQDPANRKNKITAVNDVAKHYPESMDIQQKDLLL